MRSATRLTIVTERDRLLMQWIGTNGLASLKQLQIVFWPEATERTCRERLFLLEKSGLIERHYVQTSRKWGEQVFTLTEQAAVKYFDSTMRKRLMIGLPTHAKVKQQLTAQETRIVLERLLRPFGKRIVCWQNERELHSEAAMLKRNPGSRAFGGLADVADARAFIGISPIVPPQQTAILPEKENEREATTRLAPGPGLPANNSHAATFNNGGPDHTKPTPEKFENALFRFLAAPGPKLVGVQRIDIEIDGQYWGQMLKNKITKLGRTSQPTLWVTNSVRAERIQNEIDRSESGAANVWILVVDPFL